MKNLIKNNIILAKKFNNTMRYIDDLLTLNNNQFDAAIKDIYPKELKLKRTTECATALSYMKQGFWYSGLCMAFRKFAITCRHYYQIWM